MTGKVADCQFSPDFCKINIIIVEHNSSTITIFICLEKLTLFWKISSLIQVTISPGYDRASHNFLAEAAVCSLSPLAGNYGTTNYFFVVKLISIRHSSVDWYNFYLDMKIISYPNINL